MSGLKQTPLTCSGHTRPVVHLAFSQVTPTGYYLISACKGKSDHKNMFCVQMSIIKIFRWETHAQTR